MTPVATKSIDGSEGARQNDVVSHQVALRQVRSAADIDAYNEACTEAPFLDADGPLSLWDEPNRLLFAIDAPDADHPVGYLDVEVDGPTAWIAIVVLPAYQRHGYARAALLACSHETQAVLKGWVAAGNYASHALLQRLGADGVPEEDGTLYSIRPSAEGSG